MLNHFSPPLSSPPCNHCAARCWLYHCGRTKRREGELGRGWRESREREQEERRGVLGKMLPQQRSRSRSDVRVRERERQREKERGDRMEAGSRSGWEGRVVRRSISPIPHRPAIRDHRTGLRERMEQLAL